MTKLVIGCGYLGRRVALEWARRDDLVYAVTRSPETAREFSKVGLHAVLADVTEPETLDSLPAASTVLFAVGYDPDAGHAMREVYVDGLQNVLHRLPNTVDRFIYISSTGVYGQTDGSWVDELSPCAPVREGGKVCLAAEQRLAAHALGQCRIVLRLAGIYGPGRIPRLRHVMSMRASQASAHGHLNLIHVDDAVRVVLAVEERAEPPRTYLVSDGHPVRRHDFYQFIVQLRKLPQSRFESTISELPATQRVMTDKRVRNTRMLEEIPVQFQYPSYREGLRAVLQKSESGGQTD